MSDGVTPGKYFVWQRGLRGPTPAIFHEGIPASAKPKILKQQKLEPPLDDFTLSSLMVLFPFAEVECFSNSSIQP